MAQAHKATLEARRESLGFQERVSEIQERYQDCRWNRKLLRATLGIVSQNDVPPTTACCGNVFFRLRIDDYIELHAVWRGGKPCLSRERASESSTDEPTPASICRITSAIEAWLCRSRSAAIACRYNSRSTTEYSFFPSGPTASITPSSLASTASANSLVSFAIIHVFYHVDSIPTIGFQPNSSPTRPSHAP